mmetsp:Transcript_16838/g.23577  ORF Transcript_16838/g.23577 Transcript_16838/m.23577 type:complete len:112 (-) Transcript_16838:353-688(-)|eukprot:CAMPEP_0184484088 /NCGR_PEP_ID=MMETSP0113_2-20130426/5799_1 /TAXON_ID=91329 /ORGANISM="Norrisiella sphaerica, Strain BC52" /LENGTH=111 /DNA_ID=CAMNT_0026864895 /DNA_START=147 /DNA_END=482 /DNA_ORIENTATION=+
MSAKEGATSLPQAPPKLQRQLSTNSMTSLQATFEKMGGDSKGVAKKSDALDYYNKVRVEGGLEEVAMMIDEISGDTITFDQFCTLFRKWTLPDEDMEVLLAKVKYVAKQKD